MGARQLAVVVTALFAIGCGRPSAINTGGDPTAGDPGPAACEDCDCTDDSDCDGNDYCWFANPGNTWQDGTEGQCVNPCANDNDCSVGQDCIAGRCYTQLDCNPALNSADCPPAEACDNQDRICTAPGHCSYNDDCPQDWRCDTVNGGTCVPNNQSLGECTTSASCNSVNGCTNGSCNCTAGECVPKTCTASSSTCPSGSYCAAGACAVARACPSGQDTCTPYGLVCTAGYCVNPTPCGSGNTCASGYACNTNYNPPACFPVGTNECVRDDQCVVGEYCQLFTGTCEPGCRSNTDCVGQCGASATSCSCDANRDCTAGAVSGNGSTCTDDSSCPAGTVCAINDPDSALTCGFLGDLGGLPIPGVGGGDCSKSCRTTCDALANLVENTCPAGQTCGGSSSWMSIIQQMFADDMESESASVCY